MSLAAVENYLSGGYDKIEGWISPHILRILAILSEEMNANGTSGGACEIGVYHGRFLIGLTYAVNGDRSLAIDIFDQQEFNIDYSGSSEKGLLDIFRDNASKYAKHPIGEINADSLSLSVTDGQEIVKNYGRFQIVSIDGGHEPEHVVNDYHFSEYIVHPGGAIVIDDILSPAWPGVMEGVSTLFL